ncbi:hypothetical protein SUDANB181_07695 (plasmid) [Streptomyces sp. enrichment culture]
MVAFACKQRGSGRTVRPCLVSLCRRDMRLVYSPSFGRSMPDRAKLSFQAIG